MPWICLTGSRDHGEDHYGCSVPAEATSPNSGTPDQTGPFVAAHEPTIIRMRGSTRCNESGVEECIFTRVESG